MLCIKTNFAAPEPSPVGLQPFQMDFWGGQTLIKFVIQILIQILIKILAQILIQIFAAPEPSPVCVQPFSAGRL